MDNNTFLAAFYFSKCYFFPQRTLFSWCTWSRTALIFSLLPPATSEFNLLLGTNYLLISGWSNLFVECSSNTVFQMKPLHHPPLRLYSNWECKGVGVLCPGLWHICSWCSFPNSSVAVLWVSAFSEFLGCSIHFNWWLSRGKQSLQ